MESVQLRKVRKYVDNILKIEFSKDVSKFNNVLLIHEEGSVMMYRHAFLMKIYDKTGGIWIAAVTEHHEVQIYAHDELTYYAQLGPINDNIIHKYMDIK